MEHINESLICKIAWSLAASQDLMWVKILKHIYFPHSSFINCKKKSFSSPFWSGILCSCNVLRILRSCKCLCFKVGKRNMINIWEDPWIPNNLNFIPIPKSVETAMNISMVERAFCFKMVARISPVSMICSTIPQFQIYKKFTGPTFKRRILLFGLV